MRTKQTGLKLAGLLASVSVFAASAGFSAQSVARAEEASQTTGAAKQKASVENFLGKPQSVTSRGSVIVHGSHIDYEAVSGPLRLFITAALVPPACGCIWERLALKELSRRMTVTPLLRPTR